MGETFFTSDTHFYHAGILDHCTRPFASVEEMNDALVERWNARVGSHDTVYHLGDVTWWTKTHHLDLLRRLNGRICLVAGNHDRRALKKPAFLKRFATIDKLMEIEVNGQLIVLCHYPLLSWRKSHWGSWHLHGHCHGSLPMEPGVKRMDVGVDTRHDFAPYHLDEIIGAMQAK
jgi:calcineurin-like phosphoesterase family protein